MFCSSFTYFHKKLIFEYIFHLYYFNIKCYYNLWNICNNAILYILQCKIMYCIYWIICGLIYLFSIFCFSWSKCLSIHPERCSRSGRKDSQTIILSISYPKQLYLKICYEPLLIGTSIFTVPLHLFLTKHSLRLR